MRSIFTSIIYGRLEKELPGFISRADLFAGTSGGAIVSGGLADGRTPIEIENLFYDNIDTIFDGSLLNNVSNHFGINKAKYSIDGLKSVLKDAFGEKKLGELNRKILIPTFNLNHRASDGLRHWRPKIYHNYAGPFSEPNEPLYHAVLKSAAAPTYFPSVESYVDGGLYANNPSMCALSEAVREYSGKQRLENVVLLSVGTGFQTASIKSLDNDWGYVQWFQNGLIDLLMDGSTGAIHYYCESMLGVRYKRFNPKIPEIKLDEIDKMNYVAEIAENIDIRELVNWCKAFWMN